MPPDRTGARQGYQVGDAARPFPVPSVTSCIAEPSNRHRSGGRPHLKFRSQQLGRRRSPAKHDRGRDLTLLCVRCVDDREGWVGSRGFRDFGSARNLLPSTFRSLTSRKAAFSRVPTTGNGTGRPPRFKGAAPLLATGADGLFGHSPERPSIVACTSRFGCAETSSGILACLRLIKAVLAAACYPERDQVADAWMKGGHHGGRALAIRGQRRCRTQARRGVDQTKLR